MLFPRTVLLFVLLLTAGFELHSQAPAPPAKTAPVPIYKPEPQMPPEAARAHFNGTLLVRAIIDEHGNVSQPVVVRKAGMGLDEAAVDAVRTWQFKPATENGVPVAAPVTIEITFRTLQDRNGDTGSAADTYRLGRDAARENRLEDAVRFFQKAAWEGLADAQAALGMAYLEGAGVPANGVEAALWLSRAANQGHLPAQHQLARIYAEGEGVAKDLRTALMWSLIAGKSGPSDAGTETARLEAQLSPSDVETARRMAANFQIRPEAPGGRPYPPIDSATQPPVPAGPGGGLYRIGGSVRPPVPTFRPEPEYTEEARRAGIDGSVLLSIVIAPDGTVRDVKVMRRLSYGLDEKAVEAVTQWRFKPATKDGSPVAVMVNVEVNFRLLKGNPTPP